MGRRAYSAKNLVKPAVSPPAEGAGAPTEVALPVGTREWVDKEEMLRRLKMGETFFDKLKKQGKIPYRKYSRKMLRFDPVAVEEALSKFDVGGSP